MNWQKFELEVAQALAVEYMHANIRNNVLKPGLLSHINRQCDIVIEETIDGYVEEIVVEVKQRSRQIDVKEIDAFSGMLRDIGIHRGILITSKGFSKAAINRAHFGHEDIQLDVLCFDDFKTFQAFGAIPYAGDCGVLIRAPLGWVVDGRRTGLAPAFLYQQGLTLKQAQRRGEFMYVNFWKTIKKGYIDQLIERQVVDMTRVYGSLHHTIDNLDIHPEHQTRVRTSYLSESVIEISGFIEFQDFIFFCVALCPPLSRRRIFTKVENLLRVALPIGIIQPQQTMR